MCLLKHSLLQQCNFTASLLVCDPWVCHGAEVSWTWCWDLREGGRPQDPAAGLERAVVGDLHLWSNHNTQGPGGWSETKLQGKTTAAVRQAGKLPRIRCYHHSNWLLSYDPWFHSFEECTKKTPGGRALAQRTLSIQKLGCQNHIIFWLLDLHSGG